MLHFHLVLMNKLKNRVCCFLYTRKVVAFSRLEIQLSNHFPFKVTNTIILFCPCADPERFVSGWGLQVKCFRQRYRGERGSVHVPLIQRKSKWAIIGLPTKQKFHWRADDYTEC